jgi:hypothetical protein
MTLKDLKTKYNCQKAKNEPKPNCKHCKGTGEKPIKSQRDQQHSASASTSTTTTATKSEHHSDNTQPNNSKQ